MGKNFFLFCFFILFLHFSLPLFLCEYLLEWSCKSNHWLWALRLKLKKWVQRKEPGEKERQGREKDRSEWVNNNSSSEKKRNHRDNKCQLLSLLVPFLSIFSFTFHSITCGTWGKQLASEKTALEGERDSIDSEWFLWLFLWTAQGRVEHSNHPTLTRAKSCLWVRVTCDHRRDFLALSLSLSLSLSLCCLKISRAQCRRERERERE